jgi:murein DD-endopeptidase MepM/ murein hydrolase activator NlpD
MSRRSSSSRCRGDHCARFTDRPSHRASARSAPGTPLRVDRRARLTPIAIRVVVGVLVIMAGWIATTATYLAFRNDLLAKLIARQAEMQFAYEDRIAELRAKLDRISSRQLADKKEQEQRLEQIVRRQAILESRASALKGLAETTGSIRQPARAGATGDPRITAAAAGETGGMLARLQASLDRVEERQAAALAAFEDSYDRKARRIRDVLAEIGVDAGGAASRNRAQAAGGPFVPVRIPREAEPFERWLHRIGIARGQVQRLVRRLGTVPLRKPLHGSLDLSSGFGIRTDPFNGTPAMHTGLDLLGDPGDAVRATADGAVKTAGWSGGYGKSVDLDHGYGISTRYGHLSSIEVRAGQLVKSGQVIGKVGSTGRSTGPHLHYETRVGGEAVDPQKFLRAGQRLESNL